MNSFQHPTNHHAAGDEAPELDRWQSEDQKYAKKKQRTTESVYPQLDQKKHQVRSEEQQQVVQSATSAIAAPSVSSNSNSQQSYLQQPQVLNAPQRVTMSPQHQPVAPSPSTANEATHSYVTSTQESQVAAWNQNERSETQSPSIWSMCCCTTQTQQQQQTLQEHQVTAAPIQVTTLEQIELNMAEMKVSEITQIDENAHSTTHTHTSIHVTTSSTSSEIITTPIHTQTLATSPSPHSVSILPPPAAPSLRIGHWNLCHFSSTKVASTPHAAIIAEVILNQRYDVVVLLEVRHPQACHTLVDQYLNNPQRVRPAKHGTKLSDAELGVGHWKCIVSECVEFGVASATGSTEMGKSAIPDGQLDGDIIEDEEHADIDVVQQTTTVDASGLMSSFSALSMHESHSTRHAANVDIDAPPPTPFTPKQKKMPPSSPKTGQSAVPHHLASPSTHPHHRHANSNTSASKRAARKQKEYYAFVYRDDRVELPDGCRLYQTKASDGTTHILGSPSTAPSTHEWWRSPCYAHVRSRHSSSSSSSSSSSPHHPSLSWLLVAFHAIWGDGDQDIVNECQHLQQVYSDIAHTTKKDDNQAVALIGDFNIQYFDATFKKHCLSQDAYLPLIHRPLTSTFSVGRSECNLYDQAFIEMGVVKALAPNYQLFITPSDVDITPRPYSPTRTPTSTTPTAALAPSPFPSGVGYFDVDYFPAPKSADAARQSELRHDAKKVSDHRPIWADLPCIGDVRHVSIPTPPTHVTFTPVPPNTQKKKRTPTSPKNNGLHAIPADEHNDDADVQIDPASASTAQPAAFTAPASAMSSAAQSTLSSLLSIIIVTSCIPIHPSTEVIDALLHSFKLISDLNDVPIYIMCDSPKQVVTNSHAANPTTTSASSSTTSPGHGKSSSDANIFKRGVFTEERYHAYQKYVSTLKQKYASRSEITIVQLDTYHGFAWAIRTALESYVKTPYVLITQHDYIFSMPVPMTRLVHAMHESQTNPKPLVTTAYAASTSPISPESLPTPLNYIGFVHKSVQNYLQTSLRGMPKSMKEHPLHRAYDILEKNSSSSASPLRFVPLLFHYCKNHLASVAYYRTHVLTHPRLTVGPGRFIEDEYGVVQIEDIRASTTGGMPEWMKYGSYLYQSDEKGLKIVLKHIHGRRFGQQRIGGWRRIIAPEEEKEEQEEEEQRTTENATQADEFNTQEREDVESLEALQQYLEK